jgi:hypothetical protein
MVTHAIMSTDVQSVRNDICFIVENKLSIVDYYYKIRNYLKAKL